MDTGLRKQIIKYELMRRELRNCEKEEEKIRSMFTGDLEKELEKLEREK